MRRELKTKKNIAVFIDFDATITYEDLGDELFIRYGKIEPFRSLLLDTKITPQEYWRELCCNLNSDVDIDFIKKFALEYQIDSYFKKFYDFCNELNIPITIISDGFKEYIDVILKREGIENVKIFSNYFEFTSKKVKPVFPYSTESCSCFSANCKRNSMLLNASNDDLIVYIGDGFTDFCAAEHADVVFAKKSLAAYCNKNRIPHFTYKSFFDIKNILKKNIDDNSFKVRRQAELKRKKAFEIE